MEFSGLQTQYLRLGQKIDRAVGRVLESGRFILGAEVSELESRLAKAVGAKHCVTCANGTDALALVMMAKGVGVGDAVFVPAFTFAATAEVVALRGAVPVFVDVDETCNLSPKSLREKTARVRKEGTLRPKGIIAADLFGLPADFEAIRQIAGEQNLWVLEDAAQGFGGVRGGRKACSLGDASTTSFFPSKPLGCYGDGGAVFTDDHLLAETIASLRCHGRGESKYDHQILGVNSRLDAIQAAILSVKLEAFLGFEREARKSVAQYYTKALDGVVDTPVIPEGCESAWAQYTIRLPGPAARAKLQLALKNRSIPTAVYYPAPLHLQCAFSFLGGRKGDLPVSEALCGEVLSLPMHPYLCCSEIEWVCREIRDFLKEEGLL